MDEQQSVSGAHAAMAQTNDAAETDTSDRRTRTATRHVMESDAVDVDPCSCSATCMGQHSCSATRMGRHSCPATCVGQHSSAIKQETGNAAPTPSENKSSPRPDALISYFKWTELPGAVPSRNICDTLVEVVKTESEVEIFRCPNEDGEVGLDDALTKAMESVPQILNSTVPSCPRRELSDRHAGQRTTRLRRGDKAGGPVHETEGNSEVGMDQCAVIGKRGLGQRTTTSVVEKRESTRRRAGNRRASEERRRVTRGLKTEDLMDLRVQFMTPICDPAMTSSEAPPAKSERVSDSSIERCLPKNCPRVKTLSYTSYRSVMLRKL